MIPLGTLLQTMERRRVRIDAFSWMKRAYGRPWAWLILALCVSVATCASYTGHQNFIEINQLDVGRKLDDQYATRNQYRDRLVATRRLANGHVEEEFKSGLGLKCRTFFEIDESAGKIVGWRYEGPDNVCAITP